MSTVDTTESKKPKGVKVVELSSKEIWTYEKQIELLSNRRRELEEAGVYCVSGQNIIQSQHRSEYCQLGEVVSILKQKAAGIVNPKPQVSRPQPKQIQPKERSDEEWDRLHTEFRRVRAECGI
tara:strand:+ start:111 stop:479 length:369 start_codon:yes stop_codon:yes gene_type:complete